jgi:hypothetical protein
MGGGNNGDSNRGGSGREKEQETAINLVSWTGGRQDNQSLLLEREWQPDALKPCATRLKNLYFLSLGSNAQYNTSLYCLHPLHSENFTLCGTRSNMQLGMSA